MEGSGERGGSGEDKEARAEHKTEMRLNQAPKNIRTLRAKPPTHVGEGDG